MTYNEAYKEAEHLRKTKEVDKLVTFVTRYKDTPLQVIFVNEEPYFFPPGILAISPDYLKEFIRDTDPIPKEVMDSDDWEVKEMGLDW